VIRTTAKILGYTTYAAVILLGVTFAVSNRARVDLTFFPLPYTLSMPVFLLAILLFAAGAFTGWFLAHLGVSKERRQSRQTAKRATALENEIAALRSEKLAKQQLPPAPTKPLSLAR